jgi:hypothetical protein
MSWTITPTYDGLVSDADATAYLAAVQAADGQLLEPAVRIAVNNFIVGCKADGIWSAIKASCILAGARTLAGALVPLVGTAPTNNNFVSGDYNRKTGLVGDGSTKYLNSNRNNNADPQNSQHVATYISSRTSGLTFISSGPNETGSTQLRVASTGEAAARSRNITAVTSAITLANGFHGISRSSSANFAIRNSATTQTLGSGSETPANRNLLVYSSSDGTNPIAFLNARLAFYSIGESLNLELLDNRVSALYTAIGNAIP